MPRIKLTTKLRTHLRELTVIEGSIAGLEKRVGLGDGTIRQMLNGAIFTIQEEMLDEILIHSGSYRSLDEFTKWARCIGCGVPYDERTYGCPTCAARHRKRKVKNARRVNGVKLKTVAFHRSQKRGNCVGCGSSYQELNAGCLHCIHRHWARAHRAGVKYEGNINRPKIVNRLSSKIENHLNNFLEGNYSFEKMQQLIRIDLTKAKSAYVTPVSQEKPLTNSEESAKLVPR